MEPTTCKNCGHVFEEWAEFCPGCAEPIANYTQPAGFWIRVGASLIDLLVFIPITILGFWNMFTIKSTALVIVISIPSLMYKPFMHAFFGATLGKMSCGIRVIDDEGKKLSLLQAYVRFIPTLASYAINMANSLILFSLPKFQAATSWAELGQVRERGTLDMIATIVGLLIVAECVFAAFTFRKRAIHDMIAGSFCVYKGPGE